jgi:hypothetical protein
MRATLAHVPWSDLRNAVAYMVQRGLVKFPRHFVGVEDLSDNNGGREIIFYELDKEPQETWEHLYQLAGRVKPRASRAGKKSPPPLDSRDAPPSSKAKGDAHANKDAHAEDLAYERLARTPAGNMFPDAYFTSVARDDENIFRVNNGQPADDPTVYLVMPQRIVRGYPDSTGRTVDACGPDVARFFARTAHETRVTPELMAHEHVRDAIAHGVRVLCPIRPITPRTFVEKVRRGEPMDSLNALDPQQRTELRALGFSDALLDSIYGPSAQAVLEKSAAAPRAAGPDGASASAGARLAGQQQEAASATVSTAQSRAGAKPNSAVRATASRPPPTTAVAPAPGTY